MVLPTILPRMKKAGNLARIRIDTSEIGAFVEVAFRTSKAEVHWTVAPAMLLGDDVLDVKAESRVFLRKLAILATIPSPSAHKLGAGAVH